MPGKVGVVAHIESITLIVVHRRKSGRNVESTGRSYWCRADQTAGDGRSGLGDLISIGQVEPTMAPQVWRTQRELPALNHGVTPGDRPEDIGFSNVVVVEPVVGAGFVVVSAECPTAIGNGDPNLPFDIALPVQRREAKVLTGSQSLQLIGGRGKRRCLVEVAVESAERPVQVRNPDCDADARIGPVLGDRWQR